MNQEKVTLSEFRKVMLLEKSNPLKYQQYWRMMIANLYALPPHGHGKSASEIIEMLPTTYGEVKEIVTSYLGSKAWRDQKKACNIAAWKKREAWRNPQSGYNTSPLMVCGRKKHE